jgi:molybdopterin synthase sulfur carrier subunit
MEVRVYATLRLKIGQAKIDVQAGPGDTARDAINEILERYPALAPDILTDDGELANHVHVFLNGRNVRLLGGLDSVIQKGQRLDIFPPVGGGNGHAPSCPSPVNAIISSSKAFRAQEQVSPGAYRAPLAAPEP